MSDRCTPAPPEWVHERDGRLVPFDGDKLCRSLFEATERVGRPDAFIARELTDGVLHFLAAETEGTNPTTSQIAEIVIKVVRELGHPPLAQAYAATQAETARRERTSTGYVSTGNEVAGALVREFALREVFAPELVSAHEAGLLTLTGLEAPRELAGWVMHPPARGGLFEAVEKARRIAGVFLALDGAEYMLADTAQPSGPADFARALAVGLRSTGLHAVIGLHSALPPSWAGELAEGPLFAAQRNDASATEREQTSEQLLEALLSGLPAGTVCIDWHLGERDFEPGVEAALTAVVERVRAGMPIAFAFDRPRRPVPLGVGIDRQHPATLLTVGLRLPRLAEQLERRQGSGPCDPNLFLDKLGSLARLALSAGVQKRAFLRRVERAWPAFLLDRARLVVAPVGLEAVTRRLTGSRPCDGGPALEFARQVVERLAMTLGRDGRSSHLDACLDAPAAGTAPFLLASGPVEEALVAGVTTWNRQAPLKSQVKCIGALHAVGGAGTAALLLPDAGPPTSDIAAALRTVWRQGDIARLHLLRG